MLTPVWCGSSGSSSSVGSSGWLAGAPSCSLCAVASSVSISSRLATAHAREHSRRNKTSCTNHLPTSTLQTTQTFLSCHAVPTELMASDCPRFKSDRLNRIKIFSELQIFAVLLICVVLQSYQADFSTEKIGFDGYGIMLVRRHFTQFHPFHPFSNGVEGPEIVFVVCLLLDSCGCPPHTSPARPADRRDSGHHAGRRLPLRRQRTRRKGRPPRRRRRQIHEEPHGPGVQSRLNHAAPHWSCRAFVSNAHRLPTVSGAVAGCKPHEN